MKNKFWMVCRFNADDPYPDHTSREPHVGVTRLVQDARPTVLHHAEAAARNEAERLAKLTGDRYAVLECVGMVSCPRPQWVNDPATVEVVLGDVTFSLGPFRGLFEGVGTPPSKSAGGLWPRP